MPLTHSHVINHVALSVPNLEEAVHWYSSIFGFKTIRRNMFSDRNETPDAPLFRIYGQALKKAKIAFLSTGNGVGFEIFQFIDPPNKPNESFEYTQTGIFHLCFTTPDVEYTVHQVVEQGGKLIGEVIDIGEDMDGVTNKAAYISDPWGTVVELLSINFESYLANQE